ncbi:hypothetical protein LEP1GSC202_1464 [Leptospira yanagawae serovar Saopaulo str. Sao Paulo = ATCC 700523]|uniref:Uncharacterized protein n=1 Tax=Leptospira yanagawae serovar Saopaulo str. Sao Paulo = ATCC 700523 TaxID=1249483 RepID=A0A5E8HG63_9LEPT|nr:hypothetical protein [Leptospira yanagawae]EOQ89618.1 hypothetical protein LEP1GSC202_1464 [Leptospira yanagawae serovar Saopaulo str. Sao Paulo = ATCC 700523]
MMRLVIVFVVMIFLNCATKAVIKRSKLVSTQIHHLDSVKLIHPDYDLLFESTELKTKDGTTYKPALNGWDRSSNTWFAPHPDSQLDKLDMREITNPGETSRNGGIYFQPKSYNHSWSLYRSKEFSVVYKLSIDDYTGIPKEIEYVEYENSFGICLELKSGKTCYESIPIETSQDPHSFRLALCDVCQTKIRKTIRIPKQPTDDSLIVALVDEKGTVGKMYRINTKKYGFLLQRYMEINSIDKFGMNVTWYPVLPFAFLWDAITIPFQLIWAILTLIAYSRSFS